VFKRNHSNTLNMSLFVLPASQDPLSGYVEVQEGAPSVLLPCYYKEQLLEVVTVKWSRSDLNPSTVHKRREEDDLQEQNQQFKGRTLMRPDALDSLDFSLTLKELQPSDSGVYICSIIDETEVTLTEVQLYVRGHKGYSRRGQIMCPLFYNIILCIWKIKKFINRTFLQKNK
uniref:Ig-like domain-containing protein n=1 Tax=Cyprinodon variegatus TaxID=28743 RepID=A0A3Q2E0M0_CYPVA